GSYLEHGWLDKNGWKTRNLFVESDGKIYPAYLKIAKAADGRHILYAVNANIKAGVELQRNDAKATDRSTPASDKIPQSDAESQAKHSGRNKADREYLELAKNPEANAVKLSKMVERRARAAGYDSPLLYHGTKSFGFTEFDLSKMDDKASIFTTTNKYDPPNLEGRSTII
ncbi:MAG: hypothetical protein IKR26_03460, partial [Lachnospiraceae bacterium]|nr:hypothetical protein [Lachnospiraceae bacterium]